VHFWPAKTYGMAHGGFFSHQNRKKLNDRAKIAKCLTHQGFGNFSSII
jgi:hypothetical protein